MTRSANTTINALIFYDQLDVVMATLIWLINIYSK